MTSLRYQGPPPEPDTPAGPPLLEARGLGYRYPDGQVALEAISFRLAAGERLGLVGPNGAGKSTLLLLLTGVLTPSEGTLFLEGQPVTPENLGELRRRVGVVFQHADDMLFTSRVSDDVAFGPRHSRLSASETEARIEEALSAVGAEALRDRVPHHLSGGEKRRVALASALALRPEALLLDEPTSDLDPRGRRELRELLEKLALATLVASHDLEFVLALCPRVLVLNHGHVVKSGPSREVLGDEQLMLAHGLERPHSLTPHAEPHHSGSPHDHGHDHQGEESKRP